MRPAVHHREAVRHRQGLLLVVGDVHERDPDALLERLQLHLQLRRSLASRAPRGSSSRSTRRVAARARARGRPAAAGPPTAGPGRRFSNSAQLDQLQRLAHLPARARHSEPCLSSQAEGDVVEHAEVREERVALEDRVDVALVRRHAGDVAPSSRMRPLVGSSKPAIIRSVVVLPHPDGPSSEKNSPGRMSQVDPVDGTDVGEALGQRDELDLATRHCPPPLLVRACRWCSTLLAPMRGQPLTGDPFHAGRESGSSETD